MQVRLGGKGNTLKRRRKEDGKERRKEAKEGRKEGLKLGYEGK